MLMAHEVCKKHVAQYLPYLAKLLVHVVLQCCMLCAVATLHSESAVVAVCQTCGNAIQNIQIDDSQLAKFDIAGVLAAC